jgi:adenosine deaminase
MEEVRKRGVVIECNLLSNHIMKYNMDIRSHPGIMLHNAGQKISFSSDDPGVFRISIVCHDTLAAVYAFPLDLRDLKRIQLNGVDGMLLSKE